MKQTEILLLQQYLISERSRLQSDVNQLQCNLRWRNYDSVDCLELIIAKERLSAFIEFSRCVYALLNVKGKV